MLEKEDFNELIHEIKRISELAEATLQAIEKLGDLLYQNKYKELFEASRLDFYKYKYFEASQILKNIRDLSHDLLDGVEVLREDYFCFAPPPMGCFVDISESINPNIEILAASYNNIGGAYDNQGEPEKADDSYDNPEKFKDSLEESNATEKVTSDRRKALTDALRKGEPVAVSPREETTNLSTADAIADLRAQLAGGEARVNADGTVFNLYDPSVQDGRGDGFKPVDKALVAGDNISDWDGIQVPDGKLAGGYGMCRICGEVFNQPSKFCPECGTTVVIEKPVVQLSKVEFSAIAPKRLIKGEYSIIDIVMYEEAYRCIVDEIHHKANVETQEDKKGKFEVKKSAKIKVVLTSADVKIEDNEMSGVWQGSYLNFSFPVYLPDDFHRKQVLFIAKVYVDDIILTKLTLTARCSSLFEQKINIKREDVLTAFVSYASQDRKKVAAIVQGMKKARPDMDLFLDVESLRSGDDWEKTLYHEIEKRDILYLCWSHYAKNSEWVDKEWRYAYSQKGVDGVEPLPIELPEDCPPPIELRKKHWNDKLLYLIER